MIRCLTTFHSNTKLVVLLTTEDFSEVEVFMENGVRGRAQTAGANSRRGAIKKCEISRNLFSINLHSWSRYSGS